MWQGECPGGDSSAGACLPPQPAVSSVLFSTSLSLFPSPRPHFLCTLSPFLPAICLPFTCLRLPSPSVFLCAFHPSAFHSVATLHLGTLPSLFPLFFPSFCSIPFLSLMLPQPLSAAGYRFALPTPAALFFLWRRKCFCSVVEIAEQKDLFILAVGWRGTALLA